MRSARRHRPFLSWLLAALLCCTRANAQSDTTVTYYDDTKVETTVEQTDTTARFNESPQPSYVERRLEDSVVARIRSNPAYWYADRELQAKKKKKIEEPRGFRLSGGSQTLIWLIIISIFVGLLVWILLTSDIGVFRRRSDRPLEVNEDSGEAHEDVFTLDFPAAIAQAERAGNYRLAVRLHYLSTLRRLAERGLITYTQEHTNSYYLRQLADKEQYRPFFRLTRDFEYTWYGQFALDATAYDRVQARFVDFKQSLRS